MHETDFSKLKLTEITLEESNKDSDGSVFDDLCSIKEVSSS